MGRYRIRPSKPTSAMAMAVGLVFVVIGVVVVIPSFGAFGVFWTLVAGAIAAYHAVNFFSKDGVAHQEIVTDRGDEPADGLPFDERLRRLEKLRADGLITDDEYQRKRAELLKEKW